MIPPNSAESRDVRHVVETAAILNVSEFRLFELAYQEWFGVFGKEGNLESAYMPYIVSGTVPCWLRHFVRKTMQLCDEAGLFLPGLSSNTKALASPLKSIGVWGFCLGLCIVSLLTNIY